jgi:hypothetical protein
MRAERGEILGVAETRINSETSSGESQFLKVMGEKTEPFQTLKK